VALKKVGVEIYLVKAVVAMYEGAETAAGTRELRGHLPWELYRVQMT